MKVILMERVERLGLMGDVVTVKDGFARNYLLPQGKALRATKTNLAGFDQDRGQLEVQNLELRKEAEQVAERMADLSVVLIRQASDAGQLYGSVNARDVAEAVTEAGFTIARRQINLGRPIKLLGMHPVRVQLHPEIGIEIKVNVARTADEAEAQAAGRSIGEIDDEDEEAAALAEAEEIFEDEAIERHADDAAATEEAEAAELAAEAAEAARVAAAVAAAAKAAAEDADDDADATPDEAEVTDEATPE